MKRRKKIKYRPNQSQYIAGFTHTRIRVSTRVIACASLAAIFVSFSCLASIHVMS